MSTLAIHSAGRVRQDPLPPTHHGILHAHTHCRPGHGRRSHPRDGADRRSGPGCPRYNISINIADAFCLDIPNSNPYNGHVVQQWTCNDSNAQKWNVLDSGSHYFKVQSAAWPQFCLNNWSGGGAQGDYIKLDNCDSVDSNFNTVGADFGNYWQFQPMKASANCLNMYGGQAPGAVMRLFPCSDTGPNSRFRLYPIW